MGFGPGDLRLPAEELVAGRGRRGRPADAVRERQRRACSASTPTSRRGSASSRSGGLHDRHHERARRQGGRARSRTPTSSSPRPPRRSPRWPPELAKAGCDHQILLVVGRARGDEGARGEVSAVRHRGHGRRCRRAARSNCRRCRAAGPARRTRPQGDVRGRRSASSPTKATPVRSQRVPLDARWGESQDMIELLGTYQQQARDRSDSTASGSCRSAIPPAAGSPAAPPAPNATSTPTTCGRTRRTPRP